MNIRSGQSITTEFTTRVFSTGAAANADSLPTGTLYVNGTADAATVTVTNISTGLYKAQVTLPTLAVGDVATIVIAATVSSVSDKAKIWEGTKLAVVDSAGLVDANTVKVGPSGSGTAQAAGDLYTAIAAIKAKTDNLPSDPADASDIAASFTSISNTLSTIAGYIDTEVAAIKAKTDNLPSDPADASDIAASFSAINSTLATIASYIDTEVAAIKAKTDNLPASPAAVGSEMTLTIAYDAAKTAASQSSVDDLPTNAELTTALASADDAVLAAIAALNNLSAAQVNAECDAAISDAALATNISAIKAKTDNLPSSPAAVGSAMTLTTGERTAIANEVEAQIIDETDSEKVLTAITDKIAAVNPSLSGLTLAAIASAVRDVNNATPAENSLGAAINSRASQTSVDDLPTNAELAVSQAAADDATLAAIAALNNLSASQVASAIAAYDAPTKAEMDAAFAALNDISTSEVASAIAAYDAPTKAEMDAAFSSLQTHGDDTWAPIGHGEGVNVVTITVLDEDDVPMEGARVTLAVNASRYNATCDVDGVAVFSPDEDDATYEVRISVDSLHQFTPTSLVVVGDTEATYTVTTLAITPSDDETYVTGWLIARDEEQNVLPNVKHQIRLLAYPIGHVGSSNNDELKEATSNAEGLVVFTNLIPLARYRLNVYGGNSPQEFIAPNSTPFELPSVK